MSSVVLDSDIYVVYCPDNLCSVVEVMLRSHQTTDLQARAHEFFLVIALIHITLLAKNNTN